MPDSSSKQSRRAAVPRPPEEVLAKVTSLGQYLIEKSVLRDEEEFKEFRLDVQSKIRIAFGDRVPETVGNLSAVDLASWNGAKTMVTFEKYTPFDACIRCGLIPNADTNDKKLLEVAVGNSGTLCEILDDYGVSHDGHVLLLLALDDSDRALVLRNMVGVAPFAFALLLRRLEELSVKVRRVGASNVTYDDRARLRGIWCCEEHRTPTEIATSVRLLQHLNEAGLGVLLELAVEMGIDSDESYHDIRNITAHDFEHAYRSSGLVLSTFMEYMLRFIFLPKHLTSLD
ncbi:hypothetical protein MPER_13191 [Moniliophthora perniciosa FA553]|nr:hypothetical protein MPER_13191 [Moniliophthora perniciosa FA553]